MIDIHIDCDCVLLDWVSGFREWLASEHGIVPATLEPGYYQIADWIGLTIPESEDAIVRFNSSTNFGELRPLPGAVEALVALKADGHKLTVLSSCSDAPEVIERRQANLDRHFGPIFANVLCLPLGWSKATYLYTLPRGIWIEDNYHAAVAGINAGHRSFILRRPHNIQLEKESHAELTWLDDLPTLVSLLK